ncbi:MAG: hypothetical protein U5O39_07770 [Gammaproteobacteria bacterium]|nr:hypothetical protein [Gammaproteobacteria bacterium]
MPTVPEGLKTTPTLVWDLTSDRRGQQRIETTYTADGIGWNVDYTLVLDEAEKTLDLDSWVNLTNESGKAYDNAELKLVAGEVKRVGSGNDQPRPMMLRAGVAEDSRGPQRENLSDYHLYDFPGTVSIGDKETLQLDFRSVDGVAVGKQYVSVASVPVHQSREPQSSRFDIRLNFDNLKGSSPGEPLPAGRVRVMKAGSDGNLQLLGEDRIEHTPVGETVNLVIGKAFDLGIERTQKDWRRITNEMSEVTVEVAVTNSKRGEAHLIIREKFFGDWEVISQTASGRKIDSTTLEFALDLDGGESRTFNYTVRATR